MVGSRFVAGGGTGDWDRERLAKSAIAARLSRRVLRPVLSDADGVELGDPMSGFFAIRTALVRELAPRLSAIGFKILLDLLTASPRPLRVAELPSWERLPHWCKVFIHDARDRRLMTPVALISASRSRRTRSDLARLTRHSVARTGSRTASAEQR